MAGAWPNSFVGQLRKNIEFRLGELTTPAYHATVISMIQTIPMVCGARPGIVYANSFANFVPDLRNFKSPVIVR